MTIAIIILSIILTTLCLLAWKKPDLIKRTTLHVWCDWIGTTIVGYITLEIFNKVGHHPLDVALLISGIAGVGAAWGKEFIWDKKLGLGTFNPEHAWYSVWGCVLGLVTILVTFECMNGNGVTGIIK